MIRRSWRISILGRHADQNQSGWYRLAVNLLRQEPIAMMDIKATRLKAGGDRPNLLRSSGL
jgi:hypothetical protein